MMKQSVLFMTLTAIGALASACEETASVPLETVVSADSPAAPSASMQAPIPMPTGELPGWFNCVEKAGRTLIAAHRGGPAEGYPENALPTFERAVSMGVTLLEVDVTTSADGVLFLHHDNRLERTTTGSGLAEETEWRTLRSLSLKDINRDVTDMGLVTLKDALLWSDGNAILELDIKSSTRYDDVAALLDETGAEDRVILISYSLAQARLMHRKMPDAMISASVNSVADLDALQDAGIPMDHLLAWTGTDETDPALYRELDNRGVEVIFGTIGWKEGIDLDIAATGDYGRYADMAREGVDILVSDRPVAAKLALDKDDLDYETGTCPAA